ncbi:uracil-DNA glycosylase family protein [Alicyclobacillus sendaiensis]|uniref:uracil-DNA glycosylase family protein n=1 Tax=Alicyclobacillus sendaiensis TaxID=192387 RepID=UPI0026F449F5|nr:uracil-DNA glycosylase family protein [Alicyclobacillus sendaiensis]
MDLVNTFADLVDILSKDYGVPDIVLETSTVLFILESPHRQELKHGAPVAGSSGATMSRHIFGPEYGHLPLGRMVKKNAEMGAKRPRLSAIGLINVCNIPLQQAAYPRDIQARYADWFKAMNAVRTQNQKMSFADPLEQDIQSYLAMHLRKKLQSYRGQSLTFVPCGRFAQKFFALADVDDEKWTVIDGVPHPSYNSWDRAQYARAVERVVEAVGRAGADLAVALESNGPRGA